MKALFQLDEVTDIGGEILQQVMAQREEILKAFMAKYGCHPDELEQVECRTRDGVIWYVRRRPGEGRHEIQLIT